MMTALEAKIIMDKALKNKNKVDFEKINKSIEEAAKAGFSKCRIDFAKSYPNDFIFDKVMKTISSLGYKVTLLDPTYYFQNGALMIEWGKED